MGNKKQTEKVLDLLEAMNGQDEAVVIAVDDITTYDAIKEMRDNDYATMSEVDGKKLFKITESGQNYLDFKNFQESKEEEVETQIKENYIEVTFKQKHEKMDLIESVTEKFLVETDGIPVINVTPESYKSLLDRQYNEHWQRYVGEAGSKLIKQKKLKRFYVENTNNKRRYLYIVPNKD